MKKHLLLSFFLVVLCVSACKKDNNNQKETISSPESNYTSFQILEMPLENISLNREEISGTLSGQPIKLLIENGTVNTIIPSLPDGIYTLEFTYGKKLYKSELTIKNVAAKRAAASYATEYQTSIEETIQYLDTLAASVAAGEEKERIKQTSMAYGVALNELNVAFNKLSAVEKDEFATFMAANAPLMEEIREASRILRSSAIQLETISIKKRALQSLSVLNQSSIFDMESEQAEAIKNWLRSTKVLTRNIGKLAIILYAGPAVAGAIPIIGTAVVGIAAGYMIIEVAESLKLNLDYLDTLVDKVFIPHDNVNLPDLTGTTGSVFDNQENKVVSATANYRNIWSSDLGRESGSIITSFMDTYTSFAQAANQLITKIPARFRLNLKLREFSSGTRVNNRSVHNNHVFINNVSNSEVDLQVVKQADGRFSITASTEAETDQEFSYDVVYTNRDFSAQDIKTTMKAKVLAEIDSTEIYKKAVIGHWINTWQNEYSNTVDEYDVMPDGISQYIRTSTNNGSYEINRNDPYAQYSWKIYKLNNRYYFHMPANIRNISFSGYLENYPNLRIICHPNLTDPSVTTIMVKQ